jgi:hypothetical protein
MRRNYSVRSTIIPNSEKMLTHLDDLAFLLRSPLFLHAISPRLTTPPSAHLPPTPCSTNTAFDKPNDTLDLTYFNIRIQWTETAWVTQLCYGESMLLEGRQIGVEQEVGFGQCFWWFCEEAGFLAWEFKARERAWGVRRGKVVDEELLVEEVGGIELGMGMKEKKEPGGKGGLKLKIRWRDTVKGSVGIWRVD